MINPRLSNQIKSTFYPRQ